MAENILKVDGQLVKIDLRDSSRWKGIPKSVRNLDRLATAWLNANKSSK